MNPLGLFLNLLPEIRGVLLCMHLPGSIKAAPTREKPCRDGRGPPRIVSLGNPSTPAGAQSIPTLKGCLLVRSEMSLRVLCIFPSAWLLPSLLDRPELRAAHPPPAGLPGAPHPSHGLCWAGRVRPRSPKPHPWVTLVTASGQPGVALWPQWRD